MQLSSPTLPVGAFAYSQGLESAIETRLITDRETLSIWLKDSLTFSLKNVDLPLFKRLYKCWTDDDSVNNVNNNKAVLAWNQTLFAQRETKELRDEDHQLGLALARLLDDLSIKQATALRKEKQLCFLTLFTLAASEWDIEIEQAANGFIWSWLDNQIAAAIKLVPLGQTDGQRVLSELLPNIPEIIEQGFDVKDDEIGASLPMMAILSSQHETQYSRLFRS